MKTELLTSNYRSPVRINTRNFKLRGVDGVWAPYTQHHNSLILYDHVKRNNAIGASNQTLFDWTVSDGIRTTVHNGVNNDSFRVLPGAFSTVAQPNVTLALLVGKITNNNTIVHTANGGLGGYIIFRNTTGSTFLRLQRQGVSTVDFTNIIPSTTDVLFYVFRIVAGQTNQMAWSLNLKTRQIIRQTANFNNATNANASDGGISIGGFSTASPTALNGVIGLVMYSERALPIAQIESWLKDPFDILPISTIPFFHSAGISVDVISKISIENLLELSDLNKIPIEILGELVNLHNLPMEYLLNLQLNENQSVESLLDLRETINEPIEHLLSISDLNRVPVEFGGSAIFTVAKFFPVEIIGILQEKLAMPSENLSQLFISKNTAIQSLLDLDPFIHTVTIEYLRELSPLELIPIDFGGAEISVKVLKWVLLNRKTIWTL